MFIEKIMGKCLYLQILMDNVKQSAEIMGVMDNSAFYQDNDPENIDEEVQLW